MNFLNRKETKKNSFFSKPCLEGLEIRLVPAGEFLLHSNPGATKRIFMDFDGHTTMGTVWNTETRLLRIVTPAYDIDSNPSSFSAKELANIREIWERVSEDFLPFDVDVTTEDPGIEALRKVGSSDAEWGIRAVIGQNTAPAPGAGGVAKLNSFSSNTDTPCFVFSGSLSNGNPKTVAEATSHEVGHTLGLDHDGDPKNEYYPGHGTGDTGWSPIMGNGYNQNLTQWSRGGYLGANNLEDDLAIITNATNGFGYRNDDFGNSIATASDLNYTSTTTISATGIIGASYTTLGKLPFGRDIKIITKDFDFFRFNLAVDSPIIFNINPAVNGPNLDIEAKLYNASGTLLHTSNPTDALNASFTTSILSAGTYYISINGVGRGDPLTTGYTSYGSLGFYSITGTVKNAPPHNTGAKITTASAINSVTDIWGKKMPNLFTTFRIKFDEPIQPSTFTAADITLTNSSGSRMGVIEITAVPDTNYTEFTFKAFNSDIYNLRVGPNILDLSGNQMNQDNDGINGEVTQDQYEKKISLFSRDSFSQNSNNTRIKDLVTTTSSLTINQDINIKDLNVQINLNHNKLSDLVITLRSPTGQVITLFNKRGGLNSNLVNTVFDDQATNPISSGAAPFTGSFRPESLLSTLNEQNAKGTWTLSITDSVGSSSKIYYNNILISWELIMVFTPNLVSKTKNASTSSDSIIVNNPVASMAMFNPALANSIITSASTARTSASTSSPGALPNNPTSPANYLVPNALFSSNTSLSSIQKPTTQQTVVDQLFSGLFRI